MSMNTEPPKAMDLQAFIVLLDTVGSNKTLWPAEERVNAEQLLARSAQARAELRAAQVLDQLVSAAPKHVAPPGLHFRILAGLPPETNGFIDQLVGWLTAGFWRPAIFTLTPLLFGAWLGAAAPIEDESSSALDLSSALLDEVYSTYD